MDRRTAPMIVRGLQSESGQALVLAFIVMTALSITIGGLITFTTGNETQFGRDRQLNRAFHIAEAGLNNGMAVIAKSDPSNGATIGTRIPAGTVTYAISLDGGSGSYYVKKYAASDSHCKTGAGQAPNSCWVIDATSVSPNGKIIKELQQSIFWKTITVPVDDVYGFGLFVDNGNGQCVDTHGTTDLQIDNVWIQGDFCPSGNIALKPTTANTGFVYIGGQYQGTNNSSIGTSSDKYGEVDIAGTCTVQGKLNNCDQTANIYSNQIVPNASPSALQKPDVATAAAALYSSADWTNPTCTVGAGTKPFDNTTGANQSMGTVTLLSGPSFDCKVVDNSGVTHRMAWNATTKTLSVLNGVYIDGNVNFPNGAGTYSYGNFSDGTQTNGTIYVNGTMDGSSNFNLCGPGVNAANPNYGCPLRWDSTEGNLGFAVINPLSTPTAFNTTGNGELDITLIVNQGYANTGGKIIAGPVLADAATIGGNGGFVVPGNPPGGAPTDVTTTASWVTQPGSWKELK